jgi:hypothetical protein
VPPSVGVRGSGSTAFLEDGLAQLRIDADEQRSLDSFFHELESVPKDYTVEIKKKLVTADGGIVIYTGHWGNGPRIWNLHMRRRVGNLDLRCMMAAPEETTVARGESWCASLRPITGGAAAAALPPEDPVVRLRVAGGFGGGLYSYAEIWPDGTILFRGPRCKDFPGTRRAVSPETIRSLLAAFDAAGFQAFPASFPEGCSDDVYTTVERRGPAGWKSTRIPSCSHPPPALRQLVSAIKYGFGPNPCAE